MSELKEEDKGLDEHISLKVVENMEKVKKDYGGFIVINKTDIDIVVIGRARIGKSTFLGAMINEDIGKPSAEHGTLNLDCYVRTKTSKNTITTIRYWDTKGLENWTTNEEALTLIHQLNTRGVKPFIVFYCASANGVINRTVVETIFQYFLGKKISMYYIITNHYSMNKKDREEQLNLARSVFRNVLSYSKLEVDFVEKGNKFVLEVICGDYKCGLASVNSIPFIDEDENIHHEKKNVEEVMLMVISKLNNEELGEFMLATLNNISFWNKLGAKIAAKFNELVDRVTDVVQMIYENRTLIIDFMKLFTRH